MWHGFDLEGKNWLKPAMAVPSASSGSMVATILVSVSKYGYKEMVPYINERDASSLDAYKSTKLAEYFSIDTSCAFKNGHVNPNHIFELFGHFGGHDASQVHLLLLKHIARDPRFHMK